RPNLRRGVGIVLIVAILLSLITYSLTPTLQGQYVSLSEAAGASWLVEHGPSDAVIFTDFRLAGPFVSQGFLRAIGVSDIASTSSQVNQELSEIYYSDNPCQAE